MTSRQAGRQTQVRGRSETAKTNKKSTQNNQRRFLAVHPWGWHSRILMVGLDAAGKTTCYLLPATCCLLPAACSWLLALLAARCFLLAAAATCCLLLPSGCLS